MSDLSRYKARSKNMHFFEYGLIVAGGYDFDNFDKPVVEIVNTWSEWNPGHQHLRQVAEAVKRGVWMAGGFPLEYNTLSLCPGQSLANRNMLALETQAVLLGEPPSYAERADAVVFICSCDKEIPALLMAAARINLPSIFVLGGAMLPGHWMGREVDSGTDAQRGETELRAGNITQEQYRDLVDVCMWPGCGACGPLGTANTMQCLTEALGMALPGSATTPAVMAELYRNTERAGRQVMNLLVQDIRPRHIMTPEALDNAIKVLMAMGGSTNAVIHLLALAHHLNLPLPLERFDALSRETPYLVNVKPSGEYPVVRIHESGGVQQVLKNLEPLLDTSAKTVTGQTLKENLARQMVRDDDRIHDLDHCLNPEGGLAVLRGNLAPRGAILKHVGSQDRRLLKHKGPALVFESSEHAHEVLAREDLDVTEDTVLVLRNEGPKASGMPERGLIPIPHPLARKGIKDVMRINDCRMSGTEYGTIVLHIAPEAYVGGPLAAVQNGDLVELDLDQRELNLLVPDEEIRQRVARWVPPPPQYNYQQGPFALWYQMCEQADKGCIYPWM